ncbi:MAG: polyprenyl synthetase family protein [Planctomycetes bacterium]|nr:polyprenyl synthetase family protein [Planctomycetota bacterium]
MSPAGELAGRFLELRKWTEPLLERELAQGDVPERLREAMRYALLGPGKRLRPALVRLTCEHCGGSAQSAELPAVAVEMLHTYSLVHDDLPCMDDDDLRRGRPTCHKVYGEALAVLVGDALLTESFALLARAPRGAELVVALARGAGAAAMVGGQALDLESGGATASRELVQAIHLRKTAALLAASAELGALAAGAPAAQAERARAFGLALGLAFQATDDILDVTGTAEGLGKTPGKDQRASKPTLVAALGLAGARAAASELAQAARAAAGELGVRAGEPLDALVELVLDRER